MEEMFYDKECEEIIKDVWFRTFTYISDDIRRSIRWGEFNIALYPEQQRLVDDYAKLAFTGSITSRALDLVVTACYCLSNGIDFHIVKAWFMQHKDVYNAYWDDEQFLRYTRFSIPETN